MDYFMCGQLLIVLLVAAGVLELAIRTVARKRRPLWSRFAVRLALWCSLAFVAHMTVPGRTQHVEFFKCGLVDAVSEKFSNGGGIGFGSWFVNKVCGFLADTRSQGVRVERYLGLFSIGYIETEVGWCPMTLGCLGFVCNNFLVPNLSKPSVTLKENVDNKGDRQLVVCNRGDEKYCCSCIVKTADEGANISRFELEPGGMVRIQQAKHGLMNSLKSLVNTDKSLVVMPYPFMSGMLISFKLERPPKNLKMVRLQWKDKGLHEDWVDPY